MTPPPADDAALAGFWGGGYEGADHVNARGDRLDLAAWQGHVDCLEGDHLRARAAGLSWVRESIGWRLAETAPGCWDLARAERIARSADDAGLQVAWTLWHYGIPADLCLHDDRLIPRFVAFAAEVARTIGRASRQPPLFTPVNEIGFLAWAASQRGLLHPPDDGPDMADEGSRISGYAVKRRLVRAALAAMAAMRAVEPRCRFLHVEPIVHVVAPRGQPELAPLAEQIRSWQWQTCDLLSGRAEPELGGHDGALDVIGLNHYHASQWEVLTEQRLAWHLRDARRMPLSRLLAEAWQRYRRPLVLAETGHVGAGRADWLDEVADEVRRARAAGVPVQGLCLYPLLDRPDWNEPAVWHRSGLWHVPPGQRRRRVIEPVYAAALSAWQQALPEPSAPSAPLLLVFAPEPWEQPLPQRTREIASRLAGRWRVVVVEPVQTGDEPRLDRISRGPALLSLVPHLPPGLGAAQAQQALETLLQQAWQHEAWPQPLAWLSRPGALALARSLEPAAIVVDAGCSGDEADALADADLVVRDRPGPAATDFVLPDGVDPAAGARASDGGWDGYEAGHLLAAIPAPRVLCGAIPDAAALALVCELAAWRPNWSFVLANGAGPGAMPLPPNLHPIGVAPARLLPELAARSALLLLPTPVDARAPGVEAWRALATGRAVVALGDPAPGAPPGLLLAPDADGLVRAGDGALTEPAAERQQRRARLLPLLEERSWAPAVDRLHRQLLALLR